MIARAIVCLLCLLPMLSTPARGATWTGEGDDLSWHNPRNWDGTRVPGPYDPVELAEGVERGPVIEGEVRCGEIRGPVWDLESRQVVDIAAGTMVVNGRWRFGNKGEGTGLVNVKGGDTRVRGDIHLGDYGRGVLSIEGGAIRCQSLKIGDDGVGEIRLGAGGLLDVEESIHLGGARGSGPITVVLEGGLLRIGGEFLCPSNEQRAGATRVHLRAGVIECGRFSHAGVPYSLDIEEGELRVRGDVRDAMREDIAEGYIEASGGRERVALQYDAEGDRTVVMAMERKRPWGPQPPQWATRVGPDAALRWKPAAGAVAYDVWFGARPEAIGDGAEPVVSRHGATRWKPDMEFGTTYYWRVDALQEDQEAVRGSIWRFETGAGRASRPSPADLSQQVAPETTLEWQPAVAARSYKVYLDTDREAVERARTPAAVVQEPRFAPTPLEAGQTYFWRVDASGEREPLDLRRGDVWQFTVDSGKARLPEPVDGAQWVPTETVLEWEAPEKATAFDVYFGEDREAVVEGGEPVVSGRKGTSCAIEGLERATTYYWRVDATYDQRTVHGEVWTFTTVGKLHLKVDLALPAWEDPGRPRPATAASGWAIWAAPRWRDMYMHDPVWFPQGGPGGTGILGSPVAARISNGGGGNGALHAHGLARGGLAGDKQPYGEVRGDPIANTYFYACDWAGPDQGDVLLLLTGLPAGDYEVVSYHNFWEPTEQQSRNRRDAANHMPPMPRVTVHGFSGIPPSRYGEGGPFEAYGVGLTRIENAEQVEVTSALSRDEVSRSRVAFTTDGKAKVLIVYHAPDGGYADRARPGREGGRGVLNAFEVERLAGDSKKRSKRER